MIINKVNIFDEIDELRNIKNSIQEYLTSLDNNITLEDEKEYLLIEEKIKQLEGELVDYSSYLFPDCKVTVHNSTNSHKAIRRHNCLFCANPITTGTYYLNYRPLLINHTTNEKFLLTTYGDAKVCEGCYSKIPSNITQLDNLILDVESACYYDNQEKNAQISQILCLTRDGFNLSRIGEKPNTKVLKR